MRKAKRAQSPASPDERAAARRRAGAVYCDVFPVRGVQAPGDQRRAGRGTAAPRRRCARACSAPARPSTAGRRPGRRRPRRTRSGVMRAGRDLLEAVEAVHRLGRGRADPSPRRTRRGARPAVPTARAACRRWGRPGCSSRSPWCRRGSRCAGRCRGSRRRCPPWPARERAITRQVGRRGAEPVLGLLRVERRPSSCRRPCRSRTAGCP